MLHLHLAALRSAVTAAFLLLGAAVGPVTATTPNDIIANQYIVEYVKGASHALLARDLAANDNLDSLKFLKRFDSPHFTGAALELVASTGDAVSALAANPQVANIWPNRRVYLSKPSDEHSQAQFLKRRTDTIVDAAIATTDNYKITQDEEKTPYSTHHITGVARLHAKGIRGQGVKVGVVDGGVWYYHRALGGGFGKGFKVEGGWDFVGDASVYDGEPKRPDPDPICPITSGHGTHVAGIVAAATADFVGVAPNATLYAYKVEGLQPGTDDATLIEAFLRAESDGMDVITASISSSAGWSDSVWAVVVARLTDEAGVIITVSAGNNGEGGAFLGVGAGSAPYALSVGSVQGEAAPATPFQLTYTYENGTSTVQVTGYQSGGTNFPSTIVGWPVVDMSNKDPSIPGDACGAFPPGLRNLTTAIPLIRRGGCNFQTKQTNLLALGAKHVLIYNDERPITPPGNTLPTADLGMIEADVGAAILKAMREDKATVTGDFSFIGTVIGIFDSSANTPSLFSSWSATYDLQLKPDIAAPGGNIFSTWPGMDNNTYLVQSGTSMSTPYIAGVAALYIGVHGGRHGPRGAKVAHDFHRRVKASGMTLPYIGMAATAANSTFVAPPAQMGNGLVDAWRTLYCDSEIDVTRFNLNDTAHFQGTQDLTVTNNNPDAVTYNFTLEPAAGFEILDPYNPTWGTWEIKILGELVPIDLVPDVVLPETITLAPGESKKVTVSFANPESKGWNETVIPLYSGKVNVAGDNGDRLAVGYMGVAADLYKVKKVFQEGYPVVMSQKSYQKIQDNSTYYLNSSSADFDWPAYYYQLDWGTHEMRWDIFEADWDESRWVYPPTAESGLVGRVSHWRHDWDRNLDPTDPAIVRNNTIDTPIMTLARDSFFSRSQTRLQWLGHLVKEGVTGNGDGLGGNGGGDEGISNSTIGAANIIKPGNYTWRTAASRPFADLSKVDGWEVFSHQFTVVA